MTKTITKVSSLIGLVSLIALTPVADAQRNQGGDFAGTWKGMLTMDTVYDVPADQVDRLSKPVALELRIFGRGQAELQFSSSEDEWDFREYRGFRITLVGEENGVIEARIAGNQDWMNSLSFNVTLKSQNELLVSWSRLTIRDQLLYNGLDEFAFSGVAVLAKDD